MSMMHHALTEGEQLRHRTSLVGSISLYRLPDGSGVSILYQYSSGKRIARSLSAEQLEVEIRQWDQADAEYE